MKKLATTMALVSILAGAAASAWATAHHTADKNWGWKSVSSTTDTEIQVSESVKREGATVHTQLRYALQGKPVATLDVRFDCAEKRYHVDGSDQPHAPQTGEGGVLTPDRAALWEAMTHVCFGLKR